MISFGEYATWNRESREIPKIRNITTEIEAETGTEFGYVLQIKQGKGETLEFRIDHPPFTGDDGEPAPSFTGEQFIRTNDYLFYLGDCIWEPPGEKFGDWKLTTFHNGKVIAHKIFRLKKKPN